MRRWRLKTYEPETGRLLRERNYETKREALADAQPDTENHILKHEAGKFYPWVLIESIDPKDKAGKGAE